MVCVALWLSFEMMPQSFSRCRIYLKWEERTEFVRLTWRVNISIYFGKRKIEYEWELIRNEINSKCIRQTHARISFVLIQKFRMKRSEVCVRVCVCLSISRTHAVNLLWNNKINFAWNMYIVQCTHAGHSTLPSTYDAIPETRRRITKKKTAVPTDNNRAPSKCNAMHKKKMKKETFSMWPMCLYRTRHKGSMLLKSFTRCLLLVLTASQHD